MKQLIEMMIGQILAINSNLQISYVDGLLTVGSGLSVCVTDNPVEQRSVLAGVLLGLTAPQPADEDDEDYGDEDDDEDDYYEDVIHPDVFSMMLAAIGPRPR